MQQQGYTMVWFGWQPDVTTGLNRMSMQVPVAKNPDGSAITGIVRNELTVLRPAPPDNAIAKRLVHVRQQAVSGDLARTTRPRHRHGVPAGAHAA